VAPILVEWFSIASSLEEKFEKYDYVFVGNVVEHLETMQYEGLGVSMPKSSYSLDVMFEIKGTVEENVTFGIGGGYDDEGVLHVVSGNELPEIGNTYIWFVNKSEGPISAEDDPRNILGTYYSLGPIVEARDFLKGYKGTRSFDDQDPEVISKVIKIRDAYLQMD